MNKIYNDRFQESYVEETLDNGLHVVLWEKKDFAKSFFMMATPMGSLDLKQTDDAGKEISFPAGIAHFLEHKMFEDETKDVMDVFTQMGANVNAFTSYEETVYYFSTTEDPIKPLHLLLDFVQKLNITDESVEKEKGIIIQELEMYQQMSEIRIINETLDCLFHEHPLKYDIGGDNASVSSTTREQLEYCYKLNYHPSRMLLVGVTGEDAEKLMKEIKENQSNKTFAMIPKVKRKKYNEPYEVKKKYHEIIMDVSKTKVSYAFKCKGMEDAVQRNRKEWCYKMLFDMYFSSLNPEYQQWLDNHIINHSFAFDIDFGADYGLIMFYSESDRPEKFSEMIQSTMRKIETIDEKVFQNLKNRYFGISINHLNNHKQIAVSYMRNTFGGLDFFEAMEVIETINASDLLQVLKEIDYDNTCEVRICPNMETGM